MSKTLVLKPRQINPNVSDLYLWHDFYVLINAIGVIAKGKDLGKLALWISVAGKMQQAADAIHLGKLTDSEMLNEETGKPLRVPIMAELTIKLKNQEASLLWKELSKTTWESFGGASGVVPHPGVLYEMLCDVAKQLGETIPQPENDEDEDA